MYLLSLILFQIFKYLYISITAERELSSFIIGKSPVILDERNKMLLHINIYETDKKCKAKLHRCDSNFKNFKYGFNMLQNIQGSALMKTFNLII